MEMERAPGFVRVPLVYNPRAGHGRGLRLAGLAQRALDKVGVRVQPEPTAARGDASGRVERLARAGHDRILVLGGDGTLSEAADGALRSGASPTLGFLPGGTGNSFLRDFSLLRLEDAAARIAEGAPRPFDAARVAWEGDERFCINNLQTGFGALVADLTDRRLKTFGAAGYSFAVPATLVRLSSPLTRLVLDGRATTERFALVAVCNTKRTGGAMLMAPDARGDDGLLDVVALREVGRAGLLRLFPRIFDGSHVGDPRVLVARAKEVRIEPGEPSPILADGELFGRTPVDVSVVPGALRLLV